MKGVGAKAQSMRPEISVLMTVYNTAGYLAEAIDSILAQRTTRAWELSIVDDGSSDGCLEIAQAYAAAHPERIHLLRHRGGGNRGISASRNLALRHAQGELLAFLDSDDVWLPHHLETLDAAMQACPEADMVYGSAERWVDFSLAFDEDFARSSEWGRNYLPPLIPRGEAAGLLPRGQLLSWFQADESLVPCICSVMVRTAAARAVGGFCNAFRGLYDDQAFHARMSLQRNVLRAGPMRRAVSAARPLLLRRGPGAGRSAAQRAGALPDVSASAATVLAVDGFPIRIGNDG